MRKKGRKKSHLKEFSLSPTWLIFIFHWLPLFPWKTSIYKDKILDIKEATTGFFHTPLDLRFSPSDAPKAQCRWFYCLHAWLFLSKPGRTSCVYLAWLLILFITWHSYTCPNCTCKYLAYIQDFLFTVPLLVASATALKYFSFYLTYSNTWSSHLSSDFLWESRAYSPRGCECGWQTALRSLLPSGFTTAEKKKLT